MKGLTLTSIFLASLLAFTTGAVAQTSTTDPNSGVDSAQDVEPATEEPVREQPDKSELAPNSGVDSSENVDPSADQGSTQQLEEDELAPDSGIDSDADVDPGGESSN